MPAVALAAAAEAPPPMRPVAAPTAPSRRTVPQSTVPLADFWDQMLPPALVRAPAIIAAPMGPPTPVHMTATPAATMAPAAMYSQLSDSQFPAALAAFCSIPFEACW